MSSRLPLAASLLVASLAACGGTSVNVPAAAPADSARAVADAGAIYFEFQVEHPVRALEGSCVPLYPDSLRAARTKGEVIAQFVVDTAGRPEVQTFKAIRSSHAALTSAVRDALPCMGFTPATIKGRRVRQLVQQPFTFVVPGR